MFRIRNLLFDTDPLAAHCPGPLHPDWHRFCDAAEAFTAKADKRCDQLTFLTWNATSRPDKPNGVLEKSLSRFGVQPLVLGSDIKQWCNINKLALTAEALRHVRTPYVLGADSSDVVVFRDPQLFVKRFEEHFSADLVFNASGSRCWPEFPEYVSFESSLPTAAVAQGRHWLNAGVWIGRTEFCRAYFAELAKTSPVIGYEYSEQAVVKREWPKWYPRVQLDYFSLLFQWFNEESHVMRLERPVQPRQQELIRLLRTLGDKLVGAEVGVFDGWTSEVLLRSFPHLQLWLVDSWNPYAGACSTDGKDADYFERAFQTAHFWTRFAEPRRFTLREPSPLAAARFADASLDFVFIDANHTYEHVRDDIFAWWPKVRSGGIMTGHDYGVHRDKSGEWGVSRAVNEFAAATHREINVGADGVWSVQR